MGKYGLVRQEQALRKSETQVRAILETAVDAIITINERGRIESFNPAAEKMFGYAAREAIGRPVAILMPPPYRRDHQRYVRRYLETGQARIIGIGREVVGQRRNGTTFPMYLSVGEHKIGNQRFFTGILRDLTERKRMEAEILSISEREQQRLGQDLHDGLGQLLTGAALQTKALAAQVLTVAPALKPQLERVTDLINDCIVRSREMAHGLQPISDSAEFPTALQELGFQTEKLFSIDCPVRVDALPPQTPLSTAIHLYRIVQEAIHNAVRHGAARRIHISFKAMGRSLKLSVRDDGSGFPQVRGRGMGLRIMDYRARVIGAKLDIRSTRGQGTTVLCSLDLPVKSRWEETHG